MNHDLLRRIVSIEARFEEESKWGTGFQLAPGRVLTAQHVIERWDGQGASKDADPIIVRSAADVAVGASSEAVARCTWRGSPDLDPTIRLDALDVALLEDELPADGLEPFQDFVPVILDDRGQWETQGFASANPESFERVSDHLWGASHPVGEAASQIALTVEREPPRHPQTGENLSWEGLSGAPIFVRGGRYHHALYGVLCSAPAVYEDKLFAVALPTLLRIPEFRRHIGLEETLPPHPSLVERLRQLLEADDELTAKLARLDPEWTRCWEDEGIDGLVDLLVTEGRLRDRLASLRQLHGTLEPGSSRGESFRELVLVLVALVAQHEIPGGDTLDTAALERIGQGRTELSTASECFAEVFLAGAFGTPPRFEGVPGDLPRAYLRVPTSALESGIRSRSLEADQLEEMVTDLLLKGLDHPRFLRPSEKDRLRLLPPGERVELYRRQLERNFAQLRRRHGRPPYLLAGSGLRYRLKDELDRFLRRLEQILPSLHLVELQTDRQAVERAIEQDDALYPLWEILDLLSED